MAQKQVIGELEGLVGRLMADHGRLAGLAAQTAAERDALKQENRHLQTQLKQVQKELATAQLGQGLAGVSANPGQAIARVNRLMREVDKCIALLNKPEGSEE